MPQNIKIMWDKIKTNTIYICNFYIKEGSEMGDVKLSDNFYKKMLEFLETSKLDSKTELLSEVDCPRLFALRNPVWRPVLQNFAFIQDVSPITDPEGFSYIVV